MICVCGHDERQHTEEPPRHCTTWDCGCTMLTSEGEYAKRIAAHAGDDPERPSESHNSGTA